MEIIHSIYPCSLSIGSKDAECNPITLQYSIAIPNLSSSNQPLSRCFQLVIGWVGYRVISPKPWTSWSIVIPTALFEVALHIEAHNILENGIDWLSDTCGTPKVAELTQLAWLHTTCTSLVNIDIYSRLLINLHKQMTNIVEHQHTFT